MTPCGNCDVCLNPPVTEDGTSLARLALAAVTESGQRFGAAHVVDLLRGAATEKIRGLGHDRLPAYGRGQAETKEAWRSIFRQLVAAGVLSLDISGHGGLSLTDAGRALLQGEGTFRFRRDAGRKSTARARKAAAVGREAWRARWCPCVAISGVDDSVEKTDNKNERGKKR